jgi:hypothetical protein
MRAWEAFEHQHNQRLLEAPYARCSMPHRLESCAEAGQ